MVRPLCEGAQVSFDRVREIARVFTASPVASALRFVELSAEPCAVAYSDASVIQWVKRSRGFAFAIPIGRRIGRDAVAANPADDRVPRLVPAEAWLATHHRSRCATLVEHAERVPEPGWGGWLSLLWLPRSETS